jgi:HEAT repeat protein
MNLRFTIYDLRAARRIAQICSLLLIPLPLTSTAAAVLNEEQHLIQVLQSKAPLSEKDAACARLKRIGTAVSVPALAALLNDEQLSHSARYALEGMLLPQAGTALTAALDRTTGAAKIGVINSLGVRGETQAVPALTRLLRASERKTPAPGDDTDSAAVACATATALGQIGTPQAVKALQSALKTSSSPVHDAVTDALLRCANTLLAWSSRSKARSIFNQLYRQEETEAVRIAAYRGMICAAGNHGLRLVTRGITGPPGPSRLAALQMVHEIEAPDATAKLANLLAKVQPPVQVALVTGLSQRGDPAAAPAISRLGESPAPAVRLAVIKALGNLGDASAVPTLVGFATSDFPEEQIAARQGLAQINRGNVTAALLAGWTVAQPAVRTEIARALGERGDRTAVPQLFELAHTTPESGRKPALDALALLVKEPELGSMVGFVLEATSESNRLVAAEALNTACLHLQATQGRLNAKALAQGLEIGSPDACIALLPVCSGVVSPEARIALRSTLQDPEPRVRTAAIRAMCDAVDTDYLLDLVHVSHTVPDEQLRTLAVAGCVRLAGPDESSKLTPARRVDAFRGLLARSLLPEQSRLVLAGLAEVADPEALKLVEPLLADPDVKPEAARAAIKIAAALPPTEAQNSVPILKKALQATADDPSRQALEAALKEIQANADYITTWQIAGPYLQQSKDHAVLLDIPFPVEPTPPAVVPTALESALILPVAPQSTPAPTGAAVIWRTLPPCADTKRPYVMDLLKILACEQCVAYARTWVHTDQDQVATLEVGTDDAVKVWLNGKLVHTNNTTRALQPGADKVPMTLNFGWNSLLLKMSHGNQGWAFCARLLKPDGSHLDGLTFDTDSSSH